MHIKIYQIDMQRDFNRVAFMGLDRLAELQSSPEVCSLLYDKVYEGNVECTDLEQVFRMFNLNHPKDYIGRSLSVSDVVEVIDGNSASEFHFCDTLGFKKVAFQPEATGATGAQHMAIMSGKRNFDGAIFTLTAEHLKIMSNLSFRTCFNTWAGDEIIPSIEPVINDKRPYGTSGTTSYTCELLGCETDQEGYYSAKDYVRAMYLLAELPLAMTLALNDLSTAAQIAQGSKITAEYDVSDSRYICARHAVQCGYNFITIWPAIQECSKAEACSPIFEFFEELMYSEVTPEAYRPLDWIKDGPNSIPDGEKKDAWAAAISIAEKHRRIHDRIKPTTVSQEERK